MTSKHFTARLAQANLASKSDISNSVNKADFNDKLKNIISNKNELMNYQKKLKQCQQKV